MTKNYHDIVTTIHRTYASEKATKVKTTSSLRFSVIKDTNHFITKQGPDTTPPHKEWEKTRNTESTKTLDWLQSLKQFSSMCHIIYL